MIKGFSIVEVMVIVTIIGILATLGYSRFNYHVAKTRQAEAKMTLTHLVSLQEAYLVEHGKYSWMKSIGRKRKGGGATACSTATPGEEMKNELGFRPQNCEELRYEYWMPANTGACSGAPTDPLKPPCATHKDKTDCKGVSGCSWNELSFIIRADNIPGPAGRANTSGVYIWPDCDKRDMWRVQRGDPVQQPNTSRQVLKACK